MAAIEFLGSERPAVCEIMIYPPTTFDLCFDTGKVDEPTSLVCIMVKLMEA
jgi:hypothetical protein